MKDKHYHINYSIYAKQRRELDSFNIEIKNLNSVSTFINDKPHLFICNFSFFEEKNLPCIEYTLSGPLELICQESLNLFDYNFKTSGTIIIVEDDRQAADSKFEPFICNSSILDLREIIIEEILLDLPLAPKKQSYTCKKAKKHSYYSEQENVAEEKENPFEILKTLKQQQTNKK